VANWAVFLFIGNHSGLTLMLQTVKKASAETALQFFREGTVEVNDYTWRSWSQINVSNIVGLL
jgi:hypothetical protein